MRVSVLIPAYDAAPYVGAAIDSVRAQTFDDWEIVAVDDASSDDTEAILRAYASDRIRIDRNPHNLGMTANWNRCLALARGELVLKLDADDALKPRALELLTGALDDANVIAAGVRTLSCDEALEPFDGIPGDDAMLRAGIDPYRDHVLGGERWYDFAAFGHQLWASSSFMVRREPLVALGGWDERFGCASDTELMWRVLEQGLPVAHRGAVGSLYRMRPGSVSDVYRARGWLTWEGTAANLVSLGRVRAKRPLRRSLRMHYVRQWRRWWSSAEERRDLPASICSKLDDVMARVDAPSKIDIALTRLRDAVSQS